MARRRKANSRKAKRPDEKGFARLPVYDVEVVPIERRLFPRGRRGVLIEQAEGTLPGFERRRTPGRRAEDRGKKSKKR